jgi:hypothetical protein
VAINVELPTDAWEVILAIMCRSEGLYAAKCLQRVAPVCKLFASTCKSHPDNIYQTFNMQFYRMQLVNLIYSEALDTESDGML